MNTKKLIGISALCITASSAGADGHLLFEPGEGPFNWATLDTFASENDFAGQTVTIASPWLGPDAAAAEAVMAYF